MTRQYLIRAAKANQIGGPIMGLEPENQLVRSASYELNKNIDFLEGAREGLFPKSCTDPHTV